MSLRSLRSSFLTACLASVLLTSGLVGDCRAASSLSRSEINRYQCWITAQKTGAGGVPSSVPFPGLIVEDSQRSSNMTGDRLLTAARSLLVREDFLVREWKRTESFSGEQHVATARSYRDVGEYDEAMRWYRRAETKPGSAAADDPDLRQEIFAVAVLTGDSLQVTRELLNLVGRQDFTRFESTTETAIRWLVATGDQRNLDHLIQKIESQMTGLGAGLWFWHAYVQAVRGEREACLISLRRILARTGAEDRLSPMQRGWVLRTFADLHYLDGRHDDALTLYALLAELPGDDGDWGRYQLANAHFLAGEYALAQALYSTFCEQGDRTSWADRACTMATLVAQLDAIRKEGEPYGIEVVHAR